MGFDPVAMLMHEHRHILKVVESLGRVGRHVASGGDVDADLLRRSVRFMREFADRCHHAKEEALLFPAMIDKGVPAEGCPIGALRHEHVRGRALVAALAQAGDDCIAGALGARVALVRTIDDIAVLYRSHIWKEDEMVFPMVERLFSPAERSALARRFEATETEIGADHEALAELALDIERASALASADA